jgi:NACalpha-BTF3-like transcription factor
MEIRINLGNMWSATKKAAKKVKDTVVSGAKHVLNADEEKIELIMRTKNVDRPTAKKMLAEFRETKDKDSAKTATLDNLKR